MPPVISVVFFLAFVPDNLEASRPIRRIFAVFICVLRVSRVPTKATNGRQKIMKATLTHTLKIGSDVAHS